MYYIYNKQYLAYFPGELQPLKKALSQERLASLCVDNLSYLFINEMSHCLPRDFTADFTIAVYIHYSTKVKNLLRKLHSKDQTLREPFYCHGATLTSESKPY